MHPSSPRRAPGSLLHLLASPSFAPLALPDDEARAGVGARVATAAIVAALATLIVTALLLIR